MCTDLLRQTTIRYRHWNNNNRQKEMVLLVKQMSNCRLPSNLFWIEVRSDFHSPPNVWSDTMVMNQSGCDSHHCNWQCWVFFLFSFFFLLFCWLFVYMRGQRDSNFFIYFFFFSIITTKIYFHHMYLISNMPML